MRPLSLLLLVPLLAGCRGGETVVEGTLAPGSGATRLWVLGDSARAEIAGDSFRLVGVPREVLDLRFADGEEEVARMEIRGLPEGERLRLERVWIADGLAFPAAAELDGDRVVTVNGMRVGRLPEQVDAAATVLAASRDGEALLVRPVPSDLPDLRVVVTPGTRVRTADGDPAEVDDLEFGDSLRMLGTVQSGYLLATELVLPRGR